MRQQKTEEELALMSKEMRWYYRNQDKAIATARNWQIANSERKKATNARYADRNRDKVRADARRWQRENREKCRAQNNHQAHRRRAASRETDITRDWLMALKASTSTCSLCSVLLTHDQRFDPSVAQLDHIIPLGVGGSHTMENVRYICRQCNISRPRDGSDAVAA